MGTTNAVPPYPMDSPGTFRVRVLGSPSRPWVTSMVGEAAVNCVQKDDYIQTTLVVELPDQASLIGLVNALYNAGHALLSVERVDPGEDE